MTKKLVFVGLLVCLPLAIITAIKPHISNKLRSAQKSLNSSQTTFDWLRTVCSSPSTDGFGHVTISQDILIKQNHGQISQACKVTMESGAKLTIADSQIQTDSLYISAKSNQSGNQLTITNSTLSSPGGGLQISLGSWRSQVWINRSKLSYPLSIGVSVGSADADTKASLSINDSNLSSTDQDSEGIFLVSTGQAQLNHNKFLAKQSGSAVVLANSCQNIDNRKLIEHCQAK